MSTLNEITTQLDSIKTDVVTCHTNLKSNLTAKGVTVETTDKMSNLINKVNDLNTFKNIIAGETTLLATLNIGQGADSANFTLMDTFKISFSVNGSVRIKNIIYTGTSTFLGYIRYRVLREGVEVFSTTLDTGKSQYDKALTIDIPILKGDVIYIDAKPQHGSYPVYVKSNKVYCDIIL